MFFNRVTQHLIFWYRLNSKNSVLCVFNGHVIILKSLFHGLMDKLPLNQIFIPGFAANQPLPNTYGTPIQQSVSADINQQTILSQLNFNDVAGTNQQQMSNLSFPIHQQMQNLHSNHLISHTATTHNHLMPCSGFISAQPQFNQYYQGSVSNSGGFIDIGQSKNRNAYTCGFILSNIII